MKLKLFAFLLIFFCIASSAFASWSTQETETTQDINALYLVSGSLGYAVGNNETILKTTNGITWEAITTGAGSNTYYDVIFPSASEGYVCGSSGQILKSTDGAAFTALTLPSQISSADIKKATHFVNYRCFAASNGPSANSYIYKYDSNAASWSLTELSNFNVKGVYLDPAGSTWAWGAYFAGGDSGKNAILKDYTNVWTSATKDVNDILFIDANSGYAVGESGLILKTADGGTTWTDISDASVTINDINATWFLTANFGWIVGDNTLTSFTDDAGLIWHEYSYAEQFSINDIFATGSIVGGDFSGYVYSAAAGGRILKLTSPTVTSISATIEPQSWIGTFEVIGTGFMADPTLYFSQAGASSSGATLLLSKIFAPAIYEYINTSDVTFESATRITGRAVVEPQAEIGSYSLVVLNQDYTWVSFEGFSVSANDSSKIVLDEDKFYIDNNLYYPPNPSTPTIPKTTINSQQPTVTFEVTAADNGVNLNTLKMVVSYEASGEQTYIFAAIPVSAITTLETSGVLTTKVGVNYQFPAEKTLPQGTRVYFMPYIEDLAGNILLYQAYVAVEQPEEEGVPEWSPEVLGSTGDLLFITKKSYIDPVVDVNIPVQLVLQPGISFEKLEVMAFNMEGKLVFKQSLLSGAAASSGTFKAQNVVAQSGKMVTKINWNMATNLINSKLLGNGIYLVKVFNGNTGQLVGKNTITINVTP